MEPVSIYIVDDEVMSINYMKRILAEKPGQFELVGSVTNAHQALREIPKLQPDVVLADINMPGMNGLEMVERLNELGGSSVVFLLTSHRDFDYAKRGLELGVAGYLLKHEITREQLYEECIAQVEAAQLKRLQSHSYAERNLRRFLKHGESQQVEPPAHGRGNRYYLMGFFVRSPFYIGHRPRNETTFDGILVEDAGFPAPLSCRNMLQMEGNCYCAIFTAPGPAGESRRELQSAATRVRALMADAGLDVAAMVAEGVDDVLSLPGLYRQLFQLGLLVRCREKDISFMRDHFDAEGTPEDFTANLMAVARMMHTGERESARSCLQAALRAAAEICTQQSFEETIHQAWQHLMDFCGTNQLPVQLMAVPAEGFESAEAAASFLLTLQQRVFAAFDVQKNSGYSQKIVRALEYLRHHYAEDIAIQDVADNAGLSEGHLRKLFKQEVGTTLVDFLTELRIDRAKELLLTGNYRVVDVYREAGFTSSQYFSNVFKKRVGQSPNDYLRGSIGE